MKLGHLRMDLYQEILRLNQKTGISRFYLRNTPKWPEGGYSLEAPWALQAYFRWYRRPDIFVWIEDNGDFKGNLEDPGLFIMDLKKNYAYLWGWDKNRGFCFLDDVRGRMKRKK
jgi:hypothetical protein